MIHLFRGVGRMSLSYLLMMVRSKMALFWAIAFPLFFLIAFGLIFGGGDPARSTFILPGLLTITVISASFFGIAMQMVQQRENGIFRRYRVSPVSSLSVVAAHAVMATFNLGISIALQVVAGALIFGMQIRGSLFDFVVVAFAGLFAFIPLGLVVGSVARDMKSAPAISNLLVFPMMFFSGAALPFFMLPSWVQTIAKLLPATYLTEVFQGVIFRGENLGALTGPLAVLIITGIVGFVANSLMFRWETTEPLNWRRIGVTVATLTAVYAGAIFFGPSIKMANRPGQGTNDAQKQPAEARVLRGMTVLDGLGGRIENARLLIRDGRIIELAVDSEAPLPDGVIVDELDGHYLIPGLFDSHVHIGGSAGENTALAEMMPQRQVHDLQAYLGNGVTTIVSLTDNVSDLLRLRTAVGQGTMRAPNIFFAGASITAPGGHPAARFSGIPGLAQMLTRQVATPAEARAAVAELAEKQVDLVKLVLEEGAFSGGLPRLSEAAFRAAVDEARKQNLVVTVHVDSDKNLQLALDAGVDGIEHIPGDLSDSSIARMVAAGVTLTPTLAVYEGLYSAFAATPITDSLVLAWVSESVLKSLRQPNSWLAQARQRPATADGLARLFETNLAATRRAIAGGVPIIAGSDAGNAATYHGPGLIRELELLVEKAGLPPADALRAATSRAADRLRLTDRGRIAPGAHADLVVLRGDPVADIRACRDPVKIYLNGEPIAPDTLLTSNPGSWLPGQQ